MIDRFDFNNSIDGITEDQKITEFDCLSELYNLTHLYDIKISSVDCYTYNIKFANIEEKKSLCNIIDNLNGEKITIYGSDLMVAYTSNPDIHYLTIKISPL